MKQVDKSESGRGQGKIGKKLTRVNKDLQAAAKKVDFSLKWEPLEGLSQKNDMIWHPF